MKRTYKHSYKASEKQLASLSVYNVGYQKCTPGYQWGPGIRDHYLIHHVFSGKGFYKAHGKTYALKAGDTFLVYPNTEVTYYAHSEEPWEYTWVGFVGNDVVPMLQNTDFTKEAPIIHQGSISRKIKKEFLGIYAASGNDFSSTVEMAGRLYVALSTIIKSSTAPPLVCPYKGILPEKGRRIRIQQLLLPDFRKRYRRPHGRQPQPPVPHLSGTAEPVAQGVPDYGSSGPGQTALKEIRTVHNSYRPLRRL